MRKQFFLLGMLLWVAGVHAQNPQKSKLQDSFDAFRKGLHEDFDNFRQQCMQEYAQFVRNPWVEFDHVKPVPLPKVQPVPPVVVPEEDTRPPIEDRPIVIEELVRPKPVEPQPQPVEPIEEVPVVQPKTLAFTFFGTQGRVRFDTADRVALHTTAADNVADALALFTPEAYDNMLYDCLQLRANLQLSDWAYLQMLKTLSETAAGKGTNDATLLLAWLFMQSGYQMRLATDNQRLYMLYATRHTIYGQMSYTIDNTCYYGVETLPSRLFICKAAFPHERALSLLVGTQQRFADNAGTRRTITSKRYSDISMQVSVNKNLMDFYSSYPTSMTDGNMMTRWAMYANTPMDAAVARQVYPTLRQKLSGLSQLEAVERLLNMVQTGFEYEYDDKVWGGDRAFFAEESLYYPYCDCEDRSILLTRLVRDLLGLKCLLIYYPGHLAAAVAFTEGNVAGDYLTVDGRRYVVTDGTYIGAPVGRTMPGMDNKTAKVIVLE